MIIMEIEGKVHSINGLTTAATLIAVEKKILNVGDLVKKQIAMQKCQTLKKYIFLLLIIID